MKHTLKGDTLTVWLEGELDHHTARQTKEMLTSLLEHGKVKRLVLDMKQLSFMDSSGIAFILRAQQRMQMMDGSLLVCHVPAQAKRVLDAAGISRLVTIR